MAMNYKEVPHGTSASELKKYAKGIGLVDDFVDSLEAKGLLPERFKVTRATLRGLETIPTLPEGAIRLPEIQTVGMSNKEMEKLADSTRGLNIGTWARQGLQRAATSPEGEQTLSPLAMSARTMGLRAEYPTTTQVWKKAKEFGNTISAEAMLKLAIEAAKGNIQVEIGKPLVGIMEPFTGSLGDPNVLYVGRYEDGLFLIASNASSGRQWNPDDRFVVSSRK
jgi:hypothetical protein